MARIHTRLQPKWPASAMSHWRQLALLVLLLFLGAAFAACGDGDRPLPKLGVTGTEEVEFASISAGFGHSCALKRDGSVECWGGNTEGQSTPPSGEFASVSAGADYSCGVRRDGTVQCWGSDDDGQANPPSGEFASVSAGFGHSCGVRIDGSVECWGSNGYGES
ncbi:MAG: hypothetical protein OXQ29_21170, partial [Rhodospirillaceae bacterium]|nr:hypothetical protein [Rhodospirillaceae bacterium]